MAKLIYSSISSLDGYVADEQGNFDWCAPDEEVHAFVNDLLRPVGTHLYGRRMYAVMVAWEHPEQLPDQLPVTVDFAGIWRATDKVVYSRTLDAVGSDRTGLEREFDADAVRRMKDGATGDLTIGGPALAAQAMAAGLVDELQLFLAPIVVGGGNPSLPQHVHLDLALLEERRFAGGTVFLRYRVERAVSGRG